MDETSPALLLTCLTELRDLLQFPVRGDQQEKRVDALSMFIARRAPNPSSRELAMRVLAEVAKLRRSEHAQDGDLDALLEQLRVAIEEGAGKPRQ